LILDFSDYLILEFEFEISNSDLRLA